MNSSLDSFYFDPWSLKVKEKLYCGVFKLIVNMSNELVPDPPEDRRRTNDSHQ